MIRYSSKFISRLLYLTSLQKIIQYIMLRLAEQHGRAQRSKALSKLTGRYSDLFPVCLIRLDHTSDPPTTQMVSCAMLDLMVLVGAEDGEDSTEEVQEIVGARLLDAQFYDDSQLVMVLQTAGATGMAGSIGKYIAHQAFRSSFTGHVKLCRRRISRDCRRWSFS